MIHTREYPDVPSMEVDLYAPEVIADPWPTLARIRQTGAVVWNEKGYWMTARDRICREIFHRSQTFSVKPVTAAFFGEDAFIAIDDKERHNLLRNVWAAAFRRDALQAIVGLIRSIATEMVMPVVERLKSGETVDLIPAFCRPLPAYIIAHMLGIPREMRDKIVRWSDLMATSTASGFNIDVENEAWKAAEQAKLELAEYLIDQIRYRRNVPGEDLISQIVHSEIGATLSEEAIMINTRQLLFAGNETTANWLGHIALILGRRRDVRAALDADRNLLHDGVEEMLRWEPVVQSLPRTVHGDGASIGGVNMPNGDSVVMLIGGANRDPERYENPDDLDIHRKPSANLSFGFSLHSCLGITLARLEAAETTSVLLDLMPDYELDAPVSFTGFNLRAPAALPIRAP